MAPIRFWTLIARGAVASCQGAPARDLLRIIPSGRQGKAPPLGRRSLQTRHERPKMNCVKQKSQTVCQNPGSGGFKLAVSRQIFSGALLWLIPFFPATGLAQTAAVEVRAAVEAMIEPS